jgi:hypothetical protein
MVVVDGVVVGNRLGLADLSLGWLCSTISVSATVEVYHQCFVFTSFSLPSLFLHSAQNHVN